MPPRKKTHLEPAIHRVPIQQLTIFDITESELETLEQGSPESIFLNLAVATLSVAISLTATLATATISDDRTYYVFVILVAIGYIAAITFGLLWFRSRKSVKCVIEEIRSRQPPEGNQAIAEEQDIAT